MNLPTSLHDLRDFPIVRLAGRGLPEGYATLWAAEMDALLARGQPFVLIFPDIVEHEAHADQKQRMLCLKQNRQPFAAACRGIVSIEPDKAARLLKRAQGAALAVAFGLRLKIVADRAEAEAVAARLLAGESVAEADD